MMTARISLAIIAAVLATSASAEIATVKRVSGKAMIERGKTPLAKPVRVSAGSRFVRVIKEGYVPFEQRIDIAGRTNVVVNAKLGALLRGGRLRVTGEHEDAGQAAASQPRDGRRRVGMRCQAHHRGGGSQPPCLFSREPASLGVEPRVT